MGTFRAQVIPEELWGSIAAKWEEDQFIQDVSGGTFRQTAPTPEEGDALAASIGARSEVESFASTFHAFDDEQLEGILRIYREQAPEQMGKIQALEAELGRRSRQDEQVGRDAEDKRK